MSWTDHFPVLTDEHVEEFESSAGSGSGSDFSRAFEILSSSGTRRESHFVAPVSLFLNDEQIREVRERMKPGTLSSATWFPHREHAWDSLVQPIIDQANILGITDPDLAIRVYLDPAAGFLADVLTEAGCELALMSHPAPDAATASLRRYLAFEEISEGVVGTDIRDLNAMRDDLMRTKRTPSSGMKIWRMPKEDADGYWPLDPLRFGLITAFPVRALLETFCALVERGAPPGCCGPSAVAWPDFEQTVMLSALENLFLLSAVFPRVALEGVLTLAPGPLDKPAPGSFALDIEYVTWANPESQLVYPPSTPAVNFVTVGCC